MELKSLPILVAEDEALSRRLLTRHLESLGHEVIAVANGQEALDIYRQQKPHIIVTDWMMPKMTGPEFIGRVRAEQGNIYPYIILLTAKEDPEALVEGLSSGADDFVVKPISRQELNVRVSVGMRIVDLQQKLLEANHRLQQLADVDHLSGLMNRRAMEEAMESRGTQTDMAYIMLDLDHFKNINDN